MALTLINHAGMCTTHAMMNHRVHPQEGKERNYLLKATKCHSITILLFCLGLIFLRMHLIIEAMPIIPQATKIFSAIFSQIEY